MPRISTARVQLAYNATLVGCVNQDPKCAAKLKEATDLALSLFNPDTIRSQYRVYEKLRPFATDEHCAAVEEKLDEIIYGCADAENGMPEQCFLPTPFEAMILLAAARLRTIGLLWGLFTEERIKTEGTTSTTPSEPCWLDPNEEQNFVNTARVQEFIRMFANRSARYVRRDWKLFCSWSETERRTLATLLDSYFPGKDTKTVPVNFNGCDVRKLTELLRLAATVTMVPGTCPLEIRLELKPDEICDDRKTHLAVSKFISGIHFHHGLGQIEIVAASPKPVAIYAQKSEGGSLPIVTLDYRTGLEFFASVIQSVVDTVSPYLSGCTNTRFSSVGLTCIELEGLPSDAEVDAFVYLPDHWCHVLLTASNASEVAAMVLVILKSFCEHGFYDRDSNGTPIDVNFVEQVNSVLTSAEQLHPFNESVRKLVVDVRSWTKWDGQPNAGQRALLLAKIEDRMEALAQSSEQAADDCIASQSLKDAAGKDFDVVVLHRYSRSVMTTLIESKFKGDVLIVEMEEDKHSPWIQHEGDRIEGLLTKNNIFFGRVSVGSLPSELSRLHFESKSFVLMLGTRCILHDSEDATLLTHLGTRSLVATVRDMDGKVLVVSGSEKATSEEHVCNEYRSKLKNVRRTAKPWTQVDSLSLRKHVDVLHNALPSAMLKPHLLIIEDQGFESKTSGATSQDRDSDQMNPEESRSIELEAFPPHATRDSIQSVASEDIKNTQQTVDSNKLEGDQTDDVKKLA